MNKKKYLYTILLSALFLNNNIISMEQSNYIEQETPLSSLPAELVLNIIDYAIRGQIKKTINNSYNDIFNESKINLQNIALVSRQFRDLLNVALKSSSLKNYLNQLVKELKSKRFDKLFEQLKEKSIEKYQGFSTSHLTRGLVDILESRVSKDDFKKAVELILAGANVNARDKKGRTTLMWTSIYGHKNIVEILIDKGVDVNDRDKYARTPLMYASQYGHKEIVQILLDKGADVNFKNKYGETALILASLNIVELLINKDAYANAQDNNGNTALIAASEEGHKDIVKLLKESGSK